jgi:hypothetical protein
MVTKNRNHHRGNVAALDDREAALVVTARRVQPTDKPALKNSLQVVPEQVVRVIGGHLKAGVTRRTGGLPPAVTRPHAPVVEVDPLRGKLSPFDREGDRSAVGSPHRQVSELFGWITETVVQPGDQPVMLHKDDNFSFGHATVAVKP